MGAFSVFCLTATERLNVRVSRELAASLHLLQPLLWRMSHVTAEWPSIIQWLYIVGWRFYLRLRWKPITPKSTLMYLIVRKPRMTIPFCNNQSTMDAFGSLTG